MGRCPGLLAKFVDVAPGPDLTPGRGLFQFQPVGRIGFDVTVIARYLEGVAKGRDRMLSRRWLILQTLREVDDDFAGDACYRQPPPVVIEYPEPAAIDPLGIVRQALKFFRCAVFRRRPGYRAFDGDAGRRAFGVGFLALSGRGTVTSLAAAPSHKRA